MKKRSSRRSFLKSGAVVGAAAVGIPHASYAIHHRTPMVGEIVGYGDHTYRVDKHWGIQDPGKIPVRHCHEMVQDSKGRLLMSTTHTKNNVILYDKSGRVLDTWGTDYPGIHGLTLSNEGGQDFIYLTDTERHIVCKTTITGKVIQTLHYPKDSGVYEDVRQFVPTEVAISPSGDIYVADGYGENWIIKYDQRGHYVRHFGGKGDGNDQFDCCHGITIDDRDGKNPTLLITSRSAQSFKRFTLEGKYLETIKLPGCWICRPVIKGKLLYFAAIGTKSWWDYDGVLITLNQDNKVIAAPGADQALFRENDLSSIIHDGRTFMNPHDVCIDQDENLYVPQWYSGNTYPIKLGRV